MKKLLVIAVVSIPAFAAAQTCTVTGASPITWPTDGGGIACAEGGNAVGKTTLVIAFGTTVIFDNSSDSWTGTRIEVYGTMLITANPTLYTSVTVKDGGLLDLQGKLSLGEATTPGCNYNLIIEEGGTVNVGSTGADRLTICGTVIMKGLGGCNDCGGTNSGSCPYNGQPYCEPLAGFTGPLAYDQDGYNSSLPVKLLYFDARGDDQTVALAWATIVEENFLKFIVQHSSDGVHFEDVGEVAGQGFNIYDIKSEYTFVDQAPLLGVNYYRLKAVDVDDAFEYFEVKAVRINASKRVAVYPNPSTGETIAFRLNFNPQESDRIFVIDQIGVQIFSAMATETENALVFSEPLQPGVYTLRYVSRDFEQVSRVVVKQN